MENDQWRPTRDNPMPSLFPRHLFEGALGARVREIEAEGWRLSLATWRELGALGALEDRIGVIAKRRGEERRHDVPLTPVLQAIDAARADEQSTRVLQRELGYLLAVLFPAPPPKGWRRYGRGRTPHSTSGRSRSRLLLCRG